MQYAILTEDDGAPFTVDLSDAGGVLHGSWYDIAADTDGAPTDVTPSGAVTLTPPGPWQVLRLDAG